MDSERRTDRDLDSVVPVLKSIAFFKERNITDADLSEIATQLSHEQVLAGDLVFDFGKSPG